MRALILAALVTLGACAHGAPPAKPFAMRTYYMALLYRGPSWTADDTPEVKAIGEGHMAHIREMGAAGKLLIAGVREHHL